MKLRKLIEKVLMKCLMLVRKNASIEESICIKKGADTILLNGTELSFSTKRDKRQYVEIGEKCLIKATFLFETESGRIKIGNNVHIGGAFFICRTAIIVEDDVTMAWGITIYDHNSHSIYWDERKNDNKRSYSDHSKGNSNNIVSKDWTNVMSKPIQIGSKVWIGFNVTILKGVTIGEGAVVGACSVVTKNVEPWTVVGGNPAALIKRLK